MFIADFHIHSRYSRATSRDLTPEMLDLWARRKGLSLIGTGDFTHPAWRAELREKLSPAEEGLYCLKSELCLHGEPDSFVGGSGSGSVSPSAPSSSAFDSEDSRPRFILSAEISSIYKKNGKVRKIHNVILLPSLDAADALSLRLEQIGNLHSDGRPILGLDSRDLLEITLELCPDAIFIPAHIWTPHFSLFGAYSGFDRIEECFEDLTPHIHALETGLSSDPPMNWRLSALDGYTLVSNSDAHSPSKLAREANLFTEDLSYSAISHALSHPSSGGFQGTLEFFPEEGKYHFDGHRNCKVCLSPSETIRAGGICPSCGRRITVGVSHRVEDLADRPEGYAPKDAPPFESLIPLPEVIAASLGFTSASKKVQSRYDQLLHTLGSELFLLRQAPLEDLGRLAGPCVAEGIRRLRKGEVTWAPGYDGEYGKVTLLTPEEIQSFSGQLSFLVPKLPRSCKTQQADERKVPQTPSDSAAPAPASQDFSDQVPPAHNGLNQEQWEAASSTDPSLAVIAGPGTGKTKTLVQHICFLVQEHEIPASRITAVTFTNKAAAEMRQRLEQELNDKKTARRVQIGTFHGICLKLLRQLLGNITIVDEFESLELIAEAGTELGLKQKPRDLLRMVSAVKNGLSAFESTLPLTVLQELEARYSQRLKERNAYDFDDLLLAALSRFQDGTLDRKAFDWLLVDEFQDINEIQYQLLQSWSTDSSQLFVIGDPDQAIYGFRGSDAQCFQRLAADHPKLRILRLTRNYRSTPEILNGALPIMAGQPTFGAESTSGIRTLLPHREHGKSIRLLKADSPFSEALFTVKEINRMVGGIDMLDAHLQKDSRRSRLGFSDIAILYRTHRQAELLEDCLKKESIPYLVTGREKFLSDPHVREALAFFRTLPSEQKKEKPWKQVDTWIAEHGFTDLAPLEQFRNAAVLHQTMDEFLQTLTLGQESDIRRSGSRAFHSDAVSLMTFHGSKGLEFPIVFLCGINEETVPLTRFGQRSDPAEERRLFYVAMTRAQDELILLTSPQPSPFLRDIPDGALERGTARERPKPDGKQLSFF